MLQPQTQEGGLALLTTFLRNQTEHSLADIRTKCKTNHPHLGPDLSVGPPTLTPLVSMINDFLSL